MLALCVFSSWERNIPPVALRPPGGLRLGVDVGCSGRSPPAVQVCLLGRRMFTRVGRSPFAFVSFVRCTPRTGLYPSPLVLCLHSANPYEAMGGFSCKRWFPIAVGELFVESLLHGQPMFAPNPSNLHSLLRGAVYHRGVCLVYLQCDQ